MTAWSEPRYVLDGDEVWLEVAYDGDSSRSRLVRCIVDCAAGDMARVHELPFGESRWQYLSRMRVPEGDPRHKNYKEKTDESDGISSAPSQGQP